LWAVGALIRTGPRWATQHVNFVGFEGAVTGRACLAWTGGRRLASYWLAGSLIRSATRRSRRASQLATAQYAKVRRQPGNGSECPNSAVYPFPLSLSGPTELANPLRDIPKPDRRPTPSQRRDRVHRPVQRTARFGRSDRPSGWRRPETAARPRPAAESER
jgi:hypothetical protein